MSQPPALTRTSVMRSVYIGGALTYANHEKSARALNTSFKQLAAGIG